MPRNGKERRKKKKKWRRSVFIRDDDDCDNPSPRNTLTIAFKRADQAISSKHRLLIEPKNKLCEKSAWLLFRIKIYMHTNTITHGWDIERSEWVLSVPGVVKLGTIIKVRFNQF